MQAFIMINFCASLGRYFVQSKEARTPKSWFRPAPVIDIARLRRLLDGVNAFGFNAVTGGYNRIGYSDAGTWQCVTGLPAK